MSKVSTLSALTELAGDDLLYAVDASDTSGGPSGTSKKATVDTLLAAMPHALRYSFSTTTTASDPGAGTIRFNNATPGSVTAIYVDDESAISGLDLGTMYDDLDGHRVLIVQANDTTKFLLAEVTADADSTGYWTLTVTVEDSGTLPDNGANVLMVIFPGPGGGGGGGKVLQVVPVVKSSTFTTASTSYADITGLSGSITPTSTSNKILVLYSVTGGATATYGAHVQLVRGSTAIAVGDSDGASRTEGTGMLRVEQGGAMGCVAGSYLDSPSTTSATTYKMQGLVESGGTLCVNRTPDDNNSASRGRTVSTLTLIEIDGS